MIHAGVAGEFVRVCPFQDFCSNAEGTKRCQGSCFDIWLYHFWISYNRLDDLTNTLTVHDEGRILSEVPDSENVNG